MSKQHNLIPELRFPEFRDDGEWEEIKLGELTKVISKRNKENLNLPVYSISNKNGFLPQEEQFEGISSNKRGYDISLYKIVERNTFAYNPARINVGSIGFSGNLHNIIISSLYVCFKTIEALDDIFLLQFIDTHHFRKEVVNNVEGGIRAYLFYQNFSNITLSIPSIREQQKIASCLSSLDELIAAHDEKLQALKDHKKGLMQNLFPKEGQKVPDYRFPEFRNDGEWEEIKLGELTKVISKRNKENLNLPVYSISNKNGFLPQEEQFEGISSNKRGYDISLYKIVERNTFAYNPARINVGSIGFSGNLHNIIISSLYVCFKTIEALDDIFLLQFIDTHHFRKEVVNNVEGGIRAYLFYQNFSNITLSIPSIREQQKIASCLSFLDKLIKTEQEKIVALQQHKKGLMQGLFPQ